MSRHGAGKRCHARKGPPVCGRGEAAGDCIIPGDPSRTAAQIAVSGECRDREQPRRPRHRPGPTGSFGQEYSANVQTGSEEELPCKGGPYVLVGIAEEAQIGAPKPGARGDKLQPSTGFEFARRPGPRVAQPDQESLL